MEHSIYFQIKRKPNIDRERAEMDLETIKSIMDNYYQYIMISSLKYATGIGTYASYDIAAFDIFHRRIDDIVFDVTPDRDMALLIVEKINRYRLSPIHLEDAIADMLC